MQENFGIEPQLGQDSFLPNLFQIMLMIISPDAVSSLSPANDDVTTVYTIITYISMRHAVASLVEVLCYKAGRSRVRLSVTGRETL
jgi:hypothetical protein